MQYRASVDVEILDICPNKGIFRIMKKCRKKPRVGRLITYSVPELKALTLKLDKAFDNVMLGCAISYFFLGTLLSILYFFTEM